MNTKNVTRIGGIAAALSLTAALTACAGGQSVADACSIAKTEIETATSSITSDLNASMSQATSGEKVDFSSLFQPVLDGLSSAESKVTNEQVKAPLSAFADEYRNFAAVFADFEMPNLKNIDPSDEAAMQKLQEAQAKAEEISTKGQESSTKLTAEAKKLQEVCGS